MDKNHRLDAPSNESLRTIEQIDDRSELTTLYPNAKTTLEGDLLSYEAREEKKEKERLRISLTLRRWFAVIGLLTPLPLVLGVLLFSVGIIFIREDTLIYLLLPIIFTFALWAYASYKSLGYVYNIFYNHSIRATPFVVTLLCLLLMSMQGHYVAVSPYYSDLLIVNAALSGVIVLATSIVLSGILLLIWTARRLSAGIKIACVGIVAVVILIATVLVNTL